MKPGALALVLVLLAPSLVPLPNALAQDPPDPTDLLPETEETLNVVAYLDERFDDLDAWAALRLQNDGQAAPLWHVAPFDVNGTSNNAATLTAPGGLPPRLHQALVSPVVDLTPVPALGDDEADAATDATDTAEGVARSSDQDARGIVEENRPAFEASDLTHPIVGSGDIPVQRGPAYLAVRHRYNFDPKPNEDGQALTGFVIEARQPGGTWVALEPVALLGTAAGLGSPYAERELDRQVSQVEDDVRRQQGAGGADGDGPTLGGAGGDAIDGVVGDLLTVGDIVGDEVDPGNVCGTMQDLFPSLSEGCLPRPPLTGSSILGAAGSSLNNQGFWANSPYGLLLPQAYIQPLGTMGYTGSSAASSGSPMPVTHVFDLSPWSGTQLEFRFRAATSAVPSAAGLYWAIDRAIVQAGAHAFDLRLQAAAEGTEYVAPPGEAFPLQFILQNTGVSDQNGTFEIEVTVLRGDTTVVQRVVNVTTTLRFLQTTPVTLSFNAAAGKPYDVVARIRPGHPDADTRNDALASRLPVGVVETVDLRVLTASASVQPDALFDVLVVADSLANVEIEDNITLAAFPYDSRTGLPIGTGSVAFGTEGIVLPRSALRHPAGADPAMATAEFSHSLPEGAYVLVATVGDNAVHAPLGVGRSPPPRLVEDFEDVRPGEASFELRTETGIWQVESHSDVIASPFVVDAGSPLGTVWFPRPYDSTVLDPQGGRNITSVVANPCLEQQGTTCPPEPPLINHTIVLTSPQGTQRVYGLSREVPLWNVTKAELRFANALLAPRPELGLTEARVYVATDRDINETYNFMLEQAGACDPAEPLCRLELGELGDALATTVFGLTASVTELVCGTGLTEYDLLCPQATGPRKCPPPGTQSVTPCTGTLADPATLAPALSGTLVHVERRPHPWRWTTIDLTPWAGSNVTIGFVFLADASTIRQDVADLARQNPIVETPPIVTPPIVILPGGDLAQEIGSVSLPPQSTQVPNPSDTVLTVGVADAGEPRSLWLLDRAEVVSNVGPILRADNRSMALRTPDNTTRGLQPGYALAGWHSLGYVAMDNIGPRGSPLRSEAQVLIGPGRPVAEGAERGRGIQLGRNDGARAGVQLYADNAANTGATENRWGAIDPALLPAVTVLRSPELDLRGLQRPLVTFEQRFDLAGGEGGQPVRDAAALVSDPQRNAFVRALGLTTEELTGCALLVRGLDAPTIDDRVTLDQYRCALDARRLRDPAFTIATGVTDDTVASPGVSAGLYLRVLPEDGPAQPVPPVGGYRFPILDAGGYEPTLRYKVQDLEWAPGAALSQGPAAGINQVYVQPVVPWLNATPAWAGNSDIDGDGTADWVRSAVDLSNWAGQRVRLEFVLVGRDTDNILTKVPWSIDDFVLRETAAAEESRLERLDWPHADLPQIAAGEPVPVRLVVGTPTTLSREVHARAALLDALGCIQGTADASARPIDAGGKPTTLTPGGTLQLEMLLDRVAGTAPYRLLSGVDVGQPPALPLNPSVEVTFSGSSFTIDEDTGALRSIQGTPVSAGELNVHFTASDPSCVRAPKILVARPPAANNLEAAESTNDREVVVTVKETGVTMPGINVPNRQDPTLVLVFEGAPDDAGAAHVLVQGDRVDTVGVFLPGADATVQRTDATVGAPLPVRIVAPRDLADVELWLLQSKDGRGVDGLVCENLVPNTCPLGTGQDLTRLRTWTTLEFGTHETLVTIDRPGPGALILVGKTRPVNGAFDNVLGGTSFVARDALPRGDPNSFDDTFQMRLSEGRRPGLDIVRVAATPSDGLSTDARVIELSVRNTGNTRIQDLRVELDHVRPHGQARLQSWASEGAGGGQSGTTKIGTLLPGETLQLTYPGFLTGEEIASLVRAKARAAGLEDEGVAAVRSLIDLGPLQSLLTENSHGWARDGAGLLFQDENTGKAPRDIEGSVPLQGAPLIRLADVAVVLDHNLDMEQGFDGGQILLNRSGEAFPLSRGKGVRPMLPFSPVAGDALTGTRLSRDDSIRLDVEELLGESLGILRNENGTRLVREINETVADDARIEDATLLNCEPWLYPDEPPLVSHDKPCEWARPKIPVPNRDISSGVWLLSTAPLLSPNDQWTARLEPLTADSTPVDVGAVTQVSAQRLAQVLQFEVDGTVAKAAQEARGLTLSFREARQIEGAPSNLGVEICAHFLRYSSGEEITVWPPDCPLRWNATEAKDVAWGDSVVPITRLPPPTVLVDVLRVEFRLVMERSALPATDTTSNQNNVFTNRATGWYVGPVTLTAGTVTRDWQPVDLADELYTTDPNTGAVWTGTTWERDDDPFTSWIAGGIRRGSEPIPIAGYLLPEILEFRGTKQGQEGAVPIQILGGVDQPPLIACPATGPQMDCAWVRAIRLPTGLESLYLNRSLELRLRDGTVQSEAIWSLPEALGLSCGVDLDPTTDEATDTWRVTLNVGATNPAGDKGECLTGKSMGLGPQVLATADHPLLDRTERLMADELEETNAGVTRKVFRFHGDNEAGQVIERGFGRDVRILIPLDLRFAAGSAVAEISLDRSFGLNDNRNPLIGFEARPEGSRNWRTVLVCQDADLEDCAPGWQTERVALLNLTEYLGQRLQLALRAQVHQPALGGSGPHITLQHLTLRGGVVALANTVPELRAWTDTSVEGLGWEVRNARLYGLPYDQNVGIHNVTSPFMVDGELHVYCDGSALPGGPLSNVHCPAYVGIHQDYRKKVPLQVNLYNQGAAAVTVNPIANATLRTGTTTKHECSAVSLNPASATIPPATLLQWNTTLDLSQCNFGQVVNTLRSTLTLRLYPDNDPLDGEYSREDDRTYVPMRARMVARNSTLAMTPLKVDPTRPSVADPVVVSTRVRPLLPNIAPLALRLQVIDPANDRVLLERNQAQALVPLVRAPAYEEHEVAWAVSGIPNGTWLVRVQGDLPIPGFGTVSTNATGWIVHQGRELPAERAQVPQEACDEDEETRRRVCAWRVATAEDGIVSDPLPGPTWEHGDQPPPVIAVLARWNVENAQNINVTGWTVELRCDGVEQDAEGERAPPACTGTAGRTLDVLFLGSGRLEEFPRYAQAPPCNPLFRGYCTTGASYADTAFQDPNNPTSTEFRQIPVVTGSTPGIGQARTEEGAWTLVLFDGISWCQGLEATNVARAARAQAPLRETCKLDWGAYDRTRKLTYTLYAFQEQNATMELEVRAFTAAPTALGIRPQKEVRGEAVPEGERKVLPFQAEPVGPVAPTVRLDLRPPADWTLIVDGFDDGTPIESGVKPRLVFRAPVSPTGSGQSATLSPVFQVLEDQTRNAVLSLPLNVDPGLQADLSVAWVRVSEPHVSGESLLVEARIENVGFRTSPEVPFVGVARYRDGTFDILNAPSEASVIPQLPPGGNALVVLGWTPSRAGEARVRIAADLDAIAPIAGPIVIPWGTGTLTELVECVPGGCNNVGEATIQVRPVQVADMRVAIDVLGTRPLQAGEPVPVRLTVTNAGPADVPQFRVRLLAGVTSLLESDPLLVRQVLRVGESWNTTVTLIPGRAGAVTIVATAASEERLVREARGARADGTLAEADNVLVLRIPVVARGVRFDAPTVVPGDEILDDLRLIVPVRLKNLGSENASVTITAEGPGAVGTLLGPDDTPIGSLELAPGAERDAGVLVLYQDRPSAGRHTLNLQVGTIVGVEDATVEVEVPGRAQVLVEPVLVTMSSLPLQVPVTVRNAGNAPVTALVSLDATGLAAASERVALEPGETRVVPLTTWPVGSTLGRIEGVVRVVAGTGGDTAPLRVFTDDRSLVAIPYATAAGGAQPVVRATLVNVGPAAVRAEATLVRDGTALVTRQLNLASGAQERVELPYAGQPGAYAVVVRDLDRGTTAERALTVDDLSMKVRLLDLRVSPRAPTAGETVQVRATLVNEGTAAVELLPRLYVDGALQQIADEALVIGAGNVSYALFTWDAVAGEHGLATELGAADGSGAPPLAQGVVLEVAEAPATLKSMPWIPAPWLVLAVGLVALTRWRRDRR